MSANRARRTTADRRTPPRGFTRSGAHARWIWLLGGMTLALAVGVAVLVGAKFSASQTQARAEHPDLPGIDVAGIDSEQLQLLLATAKNERCSCSCGFTLADCRHKDTTCPRSGPILDEIVKEYRRQHQSARRGE